MGFFGIRITRTEGGYHVDSLYKMAKGRVVRRASDRVSDPDVKTAVLGLLERLENKGVIKQ